MTTTLVAARNTHDTPAHGDTARTWTIVVDGMGKGERGSVEKLMLLLPEGEPGDSWFTRWRRAPDGTYSCRETVRGTHAEVAPFARAIERLAVAENFVARVVPRTYSGTHE